MELDLPKSAVLLRTDLIQIPDRRTPRRWTVVDPVSGRISRISHRDLKCLETPHAGVGSSNDENLFAQGRAAGLLTSRIAVFPRPWSWTTAMLAYQLPLFSIDSVAKWLAVRSWFIFSPWFLVGWLVAIVAAALSIFTGWSRIEASIGTVFLGTESTLSLGGATACLFAITKCIHELGHAAACRRMGAPVGHVGIFFFFGVPCPYCDVSQIWRIDSRVSRAAVMLAGIYVELIVAATATWVWWITSNGPVHHLAMHAMVVCSVSTLLFNANPLMRMDGYYVLSDLLATPNLRRQAALAWQSLVVSRSAGIERGRARLSIGSITLSLYHIAATIYRSVISIVILVTIVAFLGKLNLWWLGVAISIALVLVVANRYVRKFAGVCAGVGMWQHTAWWRRISLATAWLALLIGAMLLPVRREVRAKGIIDVMDATEVFAAESGWVEHVESDYSQSVDEGDLLVALRDPDLQMQVASWKSRKGIAAIESQYLKRKALRHSEPEVGWKIDAANFDLIDSQYTDLVKREDRLRILAPRKGVVLPVLNSQSDDLRGDNNSARFLREQAGRWVVRQSAWCRVGDPTKLGVSLFVNAEDRQNLVVGNIAHLVLDDGEIKQVSATITEIAELQSESGQSDNDAPQYVLKCPLVLLPSDSPIESLQSELLASGGGKYSHEMEIRYAPIGSQVDARICFKHEPLWRWLSRAVCEAFGG